jgi:3-hydroxyacyl-CoA dehydrogenase
VRVAAARAVELGEAPATVDFISTEGLKFFRGPLAEIDDLGPDTVLKDLNRLNDAIPERTMRAPELLRSMAKEHQTFFKDGQANPAITALLEGSAHARY